MEGHLLKKAFPIQEFYRPLLLFISGNSPLLLLLRAGLGRAVIYKINAIEKERRAYGSGVAAAADDTQCAASGVILYHGTI
jgi:hypothetical protein